MSRDLARDKEWCRHGTFNLWLILPATPKTGAWKVSSRVLALLRRLRNSPGPVGTLSSSCPIHASLIRGAPFSWVTFGGCTCQVHCLSMLVPGRDPHALPWDLSLLPSAMP